MSESDLANLVVNMARERGWHVFRLPANRTVRPVKDAVGYPDLTLARDGQVIWIELKAEGGVLSKAQLGWILDLPAMHVIRPDDYTDGTVARLLA